MARLLFRYSGPPRSGRTRLLSEIQRDPGDEVVLLGPEVTKQWFGTIRDPQGREHAIACDEKSGQCEVRPKEETKAMTETCCDAETRLLREHFPDVSEATLANPRTRRLLERELASELEDQGIALGESRRMLDAAVRPRAGETGKDALVRRFTEHNARLRLERKEPLLFSDWMGLDRVVHEGAHLFAEHEEQAPQAEQARRVAKSLSEIDRAAKPFMAKDGLTLSAARARVMSEDRELSDRYTRATMGLPELMTEE